jgi:outer membrane protein assembly factor BamB
MQDSTSRKPLRLWPGVAIVIVQWLLWFVLPVVAPGAGLFGLMGGVACGLAIVLWWLFFSRVPWLERIGALVVMAGIVFATKFFVHASISGAGQGRFYYVFSIPFLCLALTAWAVAARRMTGGARHVSLIVAIVLACAPWTLVRTAGVGGSRSEFHWRWTPTPEERLLAQANEELVPSPPPAPPAPETPKQASAQPSGDQPPDPARDKSSAPPKASSAAKTSGEPGGKTGDKPAAVSSPAPPVVRAAEWPGFRGPERDGVVRGVQIATDWTKSPPVELWRRPIGPGWSSFAVQGDFLYTQEQRGDDEIVACYRLSTGQPVWRHRDAVRFWEANGGAGPRATPTLSNGRVYAFGATGILNVLEARTGAVIWSRDVASETRTKVPFWGFASSPIVVDDLVIVAADATLVGYDVATGRRRWIGPVHRGSYSSPHRATIGGVDQILLLGGAGAQSVAPATGSVLWEHAWKGAAIAQPAVTPDGDVLTNNIAATGGNGVRRLAISHGAGGWTVEERWASTGLKPYFNDFVLHKGHAYGFDGNILACIDLEDGKRKWKGGRYGNGQLVLLADQDLLLVVSDDGELVLVNATPDQFSEVSRFKAIEGKTWNHPVLVGDVVVVRNGEEMAAFRLARSARSSTEY